MRSNSPVGKWDGWKMERSDWWILIRVFQQSQHMHNPVPGLPLTPP